MTSTKPTQLADVDDPGLEAIVVSRHVDAPSEATWEVVTGRSCRSAWRQGRPTGAQVGQ